MCPSKFTYPAVCLVDSKDKQALIWTQEPSGVWTSKPLRPELFPEPLWRVSWSIGGQMLAVSGGDHRVTLWKMNLGGSFEVRSYWCHIDCIVRVGYG
jgi:WD40 repeat protein